MSTTRFLKIAVIILLVMNVVSQIALWSNKDQPHAQHPGNGEPRSKHPHKGGGPHDFLIHELELNDDQVKQYDALVEDHQRQLHLLRSKAATFRSRMNAQLKLTMPDSTIYNQLADSIGFLQSAAEKVTYHHFEDLRKICTPKQQQRFDEVIQEAVATMQE